MLIRYQPDDGPAVEFDFIPGELESEDSEAVEMLGGPQWGTYEEFGAMFFRGSQRARRAALWVCMRRTNRKLKFADLSVKAHQITVDYSPREREMILDVMLADPNLDDDQREHLLGVIGEDTVAKAEEEMAEAGINLGHRGLPKDQPVISEDGASISPTTA